MGQHVLPGGKDLPDDMAGHAAFGHLDRGFDHRQHEAFDPKAIGADVAPLCLQQAGIQIGAFGVIGQKLGESLLRQMEEALVVPERVIRIETYCLHFPGHIWITS